MDLVFNIKYYSCFFIICLFSLVVDFILKIKNSNLFFHLLSNYIEMLLFIYNEIPEWN